MLSKILAFCLFVGLYSYASAQGGCPPYPVMRQCDPGDGSSCSKNIIPVGPNIYGQGPWEQVGPTSCCGVQIQAVLNYYPTGCYGTELRTKESQHNVLAMLIRGNDIFLLDCGGTLLRFNAHPVPFKHNTDPLGPSLRVEKVGGE